LSLPIEPNALYGYAFVASPVILLAILIAIGIRYVRQRSSDRQASL